jgi:hypothetical protein
VTRRRALISVGSIAACALAYELAVRTLADRDLVEAATRGELVTLALGLAALALRAFLVGLAPAWLLYVAAFTAHAEWLRRRTPGPSPPPPRPP